MDFRGNVHVRHLTPTQRSYFRALIAECYVGSERPRLADSPDLWLFADAETPEAWEANRVAVLRLFTRVEMNGVTLYEHPRVLEEWGTMLQHLENKRSAGLASAQARRELGKNRKNALKKEKETQDNTTPDNTIGCCPLLDSVQHLSTAVQKIDNVDVVVEKPVSLADSQSQTPAISAFRAVYKDVQPPADFNTTEPHRLLAEQFVQRHGLDVALAAWETWLLSDPSSMFQNADRAKPKTYILHAFLTEADDFVVIVLRYRKLGLTKGEVIGFLNQHYQVEEVEECSPVSCKAELANFNRLSYLNLSEAFEKCKRGPFAHLLRTAVPMAVAA